MWALLVLSNLINNKSNSCPIDFNIFLLLSFRINSCKALKSPFSEEYSHILSSKIYLFFNIAINLL